MLRTSRWAIACLVCLTLPALAETETAPKGADAAASAPLVTNGPSGTTTYFGDAQKAPPAAVAAKPPAQPEPAPTIIARVDLRSQRMTVSVNGVQRYAWTISSGVSQYPTPTGSFRPEWTSKMWYSRKYDWAPMPNAVFINGGVAVHGTYHTGALGSPASHGCIRLSTANAKTFYDLVNRHGLRATRVMVFGRPNWRDQVAVGRSAPSSKRAYAANDDSWFSNGWGGGESSAFAPTFAKGKGRGSYVTVDGVPRKIYRRGNGDVVFVERPRRRAYKTYGYGYGAPGY